MEIHGNARLLPRQRTLMCRRVRHEGWTVEEAAERSGCRSEPCFVGCAASTRRADDGSVLGAASMPGRTPPEIEALIEQLRRLRWTSTRIAGELDMATSTVCAVLGGSGSTACRGSSRPSRRTATAGATPAS